MPIHAPNQPEPRGLQLWVDLPKKFKMVCMLPFKVQLQPYSCGICRSILLTKNSTPRASLKRFPLVQMAVSKSESSAVLVMVLNRQSGHWEAAGTSTWSLTRRTRSSKKFVRLLLAPHIAGRGLTYELPCSCRMDCVYIQCVISSSYHVGI